MSEPSDSDMILATSCPHCGTECEFDLPAEATTNAELAGQIRVVCHGCEEMFQPVGDAIAGSEDIADALDQQAEIGDGEAGDAEGASDGLPAALPPRPQKRSSAGILMLSLSIILLAGAIAGASYWIANSENPAIKSYVETQLLKVEPARFEASRALFERKQTDMGETLQILVEIANKGGQPGIPQDVSLQLLDANGNQVFAWVMDTSNTVIEPGTSANYLARMVAPPADIADVRVRIPEPN